jgi:anti-anti-sigma regulatory factor
MLRITRVAGPVLKLEGRLLGPWVDELRRACADLENPPGRLCLDLAAVTFVDAAGARLLRELRQQHVTLTGCSGFVTVLLEREGS